jgi:hypothetical protein
MMRAIELNATKAPAEEEVVERLAENARVYGFPTAVSEIIKDTFTLNVSTFMTTNFKTSLPVQQNFTRGFDLHILTYILGSH